MTSWRKLKNNIINLPNLTPACALSKKHSSECESTVIMYARLLEIKENTNKHTKLFIFVVFDDVCRKYGWQRETAVHNRDL